MVLNYWILATNNFNFVVHVFFLKNGAQCRCFKPRAISPLAVSTKHFGGSFSSSFHLPLKFHFARQLSNLPFHWDKHRYHHKLLKEIIRLWNDNTVVKMIFHIQEEHPSYWAFIDIFLWKFSLNPKPCIC